VTLPRRKESLGTHIFMQKKCIFFIIAVVLLVAPVRASYSAEPTIADFLITNTQENVIVYFTVENCFTDDMEKAILAGIPTTFTFTIELHRDKPLFDTKEKVVQIKHTLKYDNVRRIFFVTYQGEVQSQEQFKYFFQAKTAMSDVSGVVVAPLRSLERDTKYYVRVKAEMEKVKLPLHLENIFVFVRLWNFETEWSRKDFIF